MLFLILTGLTFIQQLLVKIVEFVNSTLQTELARNNFY
jgi:hypothetical protein